MGILVKSVDTEGKCKMRKTYIDNIRASVVLIVLIYHVCYMFNGVGVPGGIPNAENIPDNIRLGCWSDMKNRRL